MTRLVFQLHYDDMFILVDSIYMYLYYNLLPPPHTLHNCACSIIHRHLHVYRAQNNSCDVHVTVSACGHTCMYTGGCGCCACIYCAYVYHLPLCLYACMSLHNTHHPTPHKCSQPPSSEVQSCCPPRCWWWRSWWVKGGCGTCLLPSNPITGWTWAISGSHHLPTASGHGPSWLCLQYPDFTPCTEAMGVVSWPPLRGVKVNKAYIPFLVAYHDCTCDVIPPDIDVPWRGHLSCLKRYWLGWKHLSRGSPCRQ